VSAAVRLPLPARPLRIALDATSVPSQRTGAGNYILELARALPRVDPESEYVVFVPKAQADDFAVDAPNLRLVPTDLGGRPQRLLWEQLRLPRGLRREGVDVLHSPHYTMPLVKAARSVVTICDMTFFLFPEMHEPVKRCFFRPMIRWSARHADRLITISESARADLLRLLPVRPERVVTVPLAAGEAFSPLPAAHVAAACARLGLTPQGYIGFVGVVEPRKNVPGLLEAFAGLAADFPGLQLAIAGPPGWGGVHVERHVALLGLQARVRVLGYVGQADLPAFYNGARAIVYPSRYEGFGLPVLEAMKCGVPVVTSDVAALSEVAGPAALLVPAGDTPALRGALRRVLEDADLARDLAARGRRRGAAFTWDACARATAGVYRAACGA
jgi:glycosyltransferase involved in cell wall biosynthesis